MGSIGDILRKERERQGRTVTDIAEELCILDGYVHAMESGETHRLPGFFFYKSFARQYAAILAIDEKLILPLLAALAAAEEASSVPSGARRFGPLTKERSGFRIPDVSLGWSVAGLVSVLIMCSGFYAWWSRVPTAATVHAAMQAPAPVVNPQPITSVEPSVSSDVTAVVSAVDNPIDAPAGNVRPKAEPVAPAEPESVSGVVLRLSATEKTWLSISSRGHNVFSGILQPSESKTLTGMDIATMKVGNAAGIDVDWNGKPIGPLGTRGQVLTIHFTPQAFEIVPPKQDL